MSRDGCRDVAGELAIRALGRDEPPTTGLDAHLEGCRECRAELDELRAVAAAIGTLDADALPGPVDPPPGLGDRIAATLAVQSRTRRRRRVAMMVTAAAAVFALVIAVAAVAVTHDEPNEATTTVDISGMGDVVGSARLAERAWGTEVTLDVSGLDVDEVYWLWLTGPSGDRVASGTFTGTTGSLHAVLAAAISVDETRRIWLTDESDAVIFDEPLGV